MLPATIASLPQCYVCGADIENEDELVVVSAGWEYEFQVPCHRECAPEELPPESI